MGSFLYDHVEVPPQLSNQILSSENVLNQYRLLYLGFWCQQCLLFFLVITFQSLASILPHLLVCNNHSLPFPVSSSSGDISQFITTCDAFEINVFPIIVTSLMLSVLGFWLHLFGFRNGFLLPQCSVRVNPTIQYLCLRHMSCIVQLFARALGHWYSFTIN